MRAEMIEIFLNFWSRWTDDLCILINNRYCLFSMKPEIIRADSFSDIGEELLMAESLESVLSGKFNVKNFYLLIFRTQI